MRISIVFDLGYFVIHIFLRYLDISSLAIFFLNDLRNFCRATCLNTMEKLLFRSEMPPKYGTEIFNCQIASDLKLKNPLIEKIMNILSEKGLLDEEDEVWSRLCLDEIFINAIKHGNKENKDKQVEISLYIDPKVWAIRVKDEGEGFSEDSIPDVDSEDSWELEHGRGILLIKSYMDEIWYCDNGSCVQLKKEIKNRWQKLLDKILVFLKLK